MAMQRSPEATYEIVEGRAMIVDPAGQEVITLNPVATMVWEALDGTLDAGGLADRLLPQFSDVSRDELERDIVAFVDELGSSNLIVEAAPS